MTYLINLLLIPLYYLVLRLLVPKTKADNAFMWIVAIHAVLFRALANPYNYVDTVNYARAYMDISGWTLKHTVIDENQYTIWGRGYIMYNWLLSRFSSDPKVLFIVTSVISVGGILLYIRKTAYTALEPVLLYLSYPMMYMHGFGVVRQHMAIPFLLFALYYMEKPKISLCLSIVASLIHTGCIAFLPFYLVYWLFKKYSYVEIALISLTSFIAGRIFIPMFLSLFPRYENYLHSEASSNMVPVLLVVFIILLLYEADTFVKVRNKTDRNLLLFLLYGLGLSMFCVKLPGAGRLSLPVVYAIPTVMTLLYRYGNKGKDEFKLCIAGLSAFVVLGLYLAIGSGHSPLLRYSFFWE